MKAVSFLNALAANLFVYDLPPKAFGEKVGLAATDKVQVAAGSSHPTEC